MYWYYKLVRSMYMFARKAYYVYMSLYFLIPGLFLVVLFDVNGGFMYTLLIFSFVMAIHSFMVRDLLYFNVKEFGAALACSAIVPLVSLEDAELAFKGMAKLTYRSNDKRFRDSYTLNIIQSDVYLDVEFPNYTYTFRIKSAQNNNKGETK